MSTGQETINDLDSVDRLFQLRNEIFELRSKLHKSEYSENKLSLEYSKVIKQLRQRVNYLQNAIAKLVNEHSYNGQTVAMDIYVELKEHNDAMTEEIKELKGDMQRFAEQRLTPNFDNADSLTLLMQKEAEIAKIKEECELWKNQCLQWKMECMNWRIKQRNNNSQPQLFLSTNSKHSQMGSSELNKFNEEKKKWEEKEMLYQREIRLLQNKREEQKNSTNTVNKLGQQIKILEINLRSKEDQCQRNKREKQEMEKLQNYNLNSLEEKIRVLQNQLKNREDTFLEEKRAIWEEKQHIVRQNEVIIMEKDCLIREKQNNKQQKGYKKQNNLTLKIKDLQNKLSGIVQKNNNLIRQNEQFNEYVNESKQIIGWKEEKISQLQQNVKQGNENNKKNKKQIQRLTKELNKLSQQLNKANKKHTKQLQQQQQHKNKINQIMKIQLQEKANELKKVKAELKDKSVSLISVTANLKDIQTDYLNLKQVYEDLQQKYNHLSEVERQLQIMKDQLDNERTRQRKQVQQINKIRQSHITSLSSTQQKEIAILNEQMTKIRIQLTNYRTQLSQKQSQLIQAKQQCVDLKQQCVKLKSQNTLLKQELKLQKEQLKQQKEYYKASQRSKQNKQDKSEGEDTRLKELESIAEIERQKSHQLLLKLSSTETELSRLLIEVSNRDEEIRKSQQNVSTAKNNRYLSPQHNFHNLVKRDIIFQQNSMETSLPRHSNLHYKNTNQMQGQQSNNGYLHNTNGSLHNTNGYNNGYLYNTNSHLQNNHGHQHNNNAYSHNNYLQSHQQSHFSQIKGSNYKQRTTNRTYKDIERQNEELRNRAKYIQEDRNVWKIKYKEFKSKIVMCPHLQRKQKRTDEPISKFYIPPKVSKI